MLLRTPWARGVTTSACLAVAATAIVPTAAFAAPSDPAAPDLLVTEIAANNAGADTMEYVEIHNAGTADVDLSTDVSVLYTYPAEDSHTDAPLTIPAGTVVPAGGTVVLWLDDHQGANGVAESDFRAHWDGVAGTTGAYTVVPVTTAKDMANGGNRGIRITAADGTELVEAFYPAGSVDSDKVVQFARPEGASTDMGVLATLAAPTPGVVDPTQLAPLAAAPAPAVSPAPAASAAPDAGPAQPSPAVAGLEVTELAPDNEGYDDFEFIEIHNAGTADVDLADLTVAYMYAESDTSQDKPLSIPAGTVVASGETVVLWLQYATSTVDTAARTDDEFRAHYTRDGGQPGTYALVRVSGQPGMSNSGDRGIRITNPGGQELVHAYYPAGSVGPDLTAHFAGVQGTAMTLALGQGIPTPGDPADAGAPAPATPSPAPADPTPAPSAPAAPAFDPQPDSTLVTAPLQITELLPDSDNVDGGDGYEFIEVYNASSEDVDFGDYVLNYLYPLGDLTSAQEARWSSEPADVTIGAGKTLVFWVKTGKNDQLTVADFNSFFHTALVEGTDIVEVHAAGMSNGSPRGMEIITRTGHPGNRAYYNLGGVDDTTANQGIQYAIDPDDLTLQTKVGVAPATPGSVDPSQVPAGLMEIPADTTAPTIDDHSPSSVSRGEDLTLDFEIHDDVEVKRVALEYKGAHDADWTAVELSDATPFQFSHTIAAVDLTGEPTVAYRVVASDGTQETTLAETTVAIAGGAVDPIRLNVADGDVVSGTTELIGSADAGTPALAVDGTAVTGAPSMEFAPVFAFEATATNVFFRNGVRIGDDVLTVFDDTIASGWETISTPVDLSYVTEGDELVVSIWAGTKAAPEIDPDENNDDFQVKNLRLLLPDGRSLTPSGYSGEELKMGDSTGKHDFFDAHFTLPADAFGSVAQAWDTTAVADGEHTVAATLGSESAEARLLVDNTAPVIDTAMVDGQEYRGDFTIDAKASDAGSGVETVVATLDGEEIALPAAASSTVLDAGDHTFAVTATDVAGNETTRTLAFTTPVEDPDLALGGPADGATATGEATLEATGTDPSGDSLTMCFAEATHLDATDDAVTVTSGTTRATRTAERQGTVLSGAELEQMVDLDGVTVEATTEDAFPFQMFDVDVPAGAGDDADVRVAWDGSADAGAKVRLLVRDVARDAWETVDEHLNGDTAEDFSLTALVPVAGHVQDGKVTVLVQHSDGFAGEARSTRSTAVTPANPGDTPRSEYDFTVGVETDTQYYNETPGFYKHQQGIHSYFLDRRDELNLQYVAHDGDIVDVFDDLAQWHRADDTYRRLDEAGLPYGVLAGNHDVGHKEGDYANYQHYFGASRFQDNPWYGGSYQDNRGHYDLISSNGVDLIFVYQGWGPGDEEIAWMNDVLAQYPERVAVLNFHEYILTTGGLGPTPQQIQDEVVATNPNVRAVFSGHYHDAHDRVDRFDDDGDGTPDRVVHQMLFDYQGLPEGGLGYLRLLHFDNAGRQMIVRTYSPTLDDYDADDPTLPLEDQELTVSYDDLGIEVHPRSLATDAMSIDVLTHHDIDCVTDVASGDAATAAWSGAPAGAHGWYVTATDQYGGIARSEVREVVFDGTGAATPSASECTPVDLVDIAGMLHEEHMRWMAEQCLTTGWPTSHGAEFRPLETTHRDAIAAFLYRAAGEPDFDAPAKPTFSDVDTDNMYYREIEWAAAEGIVHGWPDGTFRPLENAHRDAIAAFLYRAAGEPTPVDMTVLDGFSDVVPTQQHATAIAWMAEQGISTGWPDHTFRPLENITRDAFAAFLHRADGV